MKLELEALFKSTLDGTVVRIEEISEGELHPAELERFTIDVSKPVDVKLLADKVVKGFHARSISAEHVPHSSSVSHVKLSRADFRASVVILSEEKFISVTAFRLS